MPSSADSTSHPHVIKSGDEARREVRTLERSLDELPPQRIPKDRAKVTGASERPPVVIPQRLLAKEQQELSATPYTIPTFEDLPEHPLPPPQDTGTEEVEEEPEPTVEEQIAEARARWEEELEEARAEARAEGFEEGKATAEAALKKQVHAQKSVLEETINHLKKRWGDFLEESEPLLATLSFKIAEAILDAELPATVKGTAGRVLSEAIDELADQPPVRISIHPVDYLQLQEEGVVETLDNMHESLHWNPDPAYAEGDWEVQSARANIRHIRSEMLETMQRRMGLLGLVQRSQKEQSESAEESASNTLE